MKNEKSAPAAKDYALRKKQTAERIEAVKAFIKIFAHKHAMIYTYPEFTIFSRDISDARLMNLLKADIISAGIKEKDAEDFAKFLIEARKEGKTNFYMDKNEILHYYHPDEKVSLPIFAEQRFYGEVDHNSYGFHDCTKPRALLTPS